MSAVHRHVTTGIWLLTNSGTDGLTPDQVKAYGEPEAALTPTTPAIIDPQEWDPSPCCIHMDVPGEAGEVWPMAAVPTGPTANYGKKVRADGGGGRQRRSRRAWDPNAPMSHAVRESKKSRSRSGSGSKRPQRGNTTSDNAKLRRRHRRAVRKEIEPIQVMWPMNFHDTAFHLDGLGYVNGPPEPEQHQDAINQHDKIFTLLGDQLVTSNEVQQASRGSRTMLQGDSQNMSCGSGSGGISGAEVTTASHSHHSTSSPTTGVWQDASVVTETAVASRTSSNGNSQLGSSEESPSLSAQKVPAAFSSDNTYVHTNSQNSGESDLPVEPTCDLPYLPPFCSPDLDGPMTIDAAASRQDHGELCGFDPDMSYKIYHPRQNDYDVLQAEESRRHRSVPWANVNSTDFNRTNYGNSMANTTTTNYPPFQSSAVAVPLKVEAPLPTSPPPQAVLPPPPAVPPPPLHFMQELPSIGVASLPSPIFQQVDSPQATAGRWIEQQDQGELHFELHQQMGQKHQLDCLSTHHGQQYQQG